MNTLNSDAVADRALHRRELDVVVRRGLAWFTDDQIDVKMHEISMKIQSCLKDLPHPIPHCGVLPRSWLPNCRRGGCIGVMTWLA